MTGRSALISSGEDQLKRFGSFLDSYEKRLRTFLLKAGRNERSDIITLRRDWWLVNVNYSTNKESLQLLRLLEADSPPNKIILTFGHLCNESLELVAEAKRMHLQLLYMDEDLCSTSDNQCGSDMELNNPESKNERFLLKMSTSIGFLCKVHFLLQRCFALTNSLLHQCGALLATEGSTFKLLDVLDCTVDVLLRIVIFDEILLNSNFRRSWPAYKNTLNVTALKHIDQEFGSYSEVNGLLNWLQELDLLFSGALFRTFLDGTFPLKDKIGAKGLSHLAHQFHEYMKHNLSIIERLNSPDLMDPSEAHLLVRVNIFCVVIFNFCGHIDPKILKSLLELNVKHTGITLISNVSWQPWTFLRRHAEPILKSFQKHLQDDSRHMQNFMDTRKLTLQRDCKNYCERIALWLLHMKRMLRSCAVDLKVKQCKELSTLLLQGLQYMGKLRFLIKALINAHVYLQTPMSKATLLIICKLFEMLKSVQLMFRENTEYISAVIQWILQHLQYEIFHILTACKNKIVGSVMDERQIDALAGLKVAERCMNGPATNMRVLVLKLAVNCMNYNNHILSSDQSDSLALTVKRITLFANFQEYFNESCEISFTFWQQSILTSYLKQVIEKRKEFNSFQFVIQAMNDCVDWLDIIKATDSQLFYAIEKSNFENIRREIISNLCAEIETYLRLEVHSSLLMDKIGSSEQNINNYRYLIDMAPIKMNESYVILKDHVENYLSTMFYNLTAINLHDWQTYEEMRQIAKSRLNLNPVKDYLPNQTMDMGVDILEIMRNIQVFAPKYVYNMHTQIFVERQSNNKHLRKTGIQHVANSLCTHGTGIINTTVNFMYQYLRQKFYMFSQFLYDEQIKSRLIKEMRTFLERKQSCHFPLYPYERADAFNRDVRNLGLFDEGQSYMDLFRELITHIGNAMGYIRLIRAGSIHANHSASLYLPRFDENLELVKSCREDTLEDVTINAAESFELNVQNLNKSFSDKTDYFRILVEAFQPFFRNPHNNHLKMFYLIIPPLTLNYIEYILREKENINKKDKHGTVFFDDGFAVGLSYILKLLNQTVDFNALQWFATVRSRFSAESHKIRAMRAQDHSKTAANTLKKTERAKLQQTLVLTERRLNLYQSNFNLLYFNLCSAKTLFQ